MQDKLIDKLVKINEELTVTLELLKQPAVQLEDGKKSMNIFPNPSREALQGKRLFKVLEVTGKKDGAHQPARWFKVGHEGAARKYLVTLSQGNAWVSSAFKDEEGEIRTFNRKRINLSHPTAI